MRFKEIKKQIFVEIKEIFKEKMLGSKVQSGVCVNKTKKQNIFKGINQEIFE